MTQVHRKGERKFKGDGTSLSLSNSRRSNACYWLCIATRR